MPPTLPKALRALVLSALGLSASSAWADTPVAPPIAGGCSAAARGVEQRLERRVTGKSYGSVRRQFLAAGWRPAPLQQMDRREILDAPDPPGIGIYGVSEYIYNKGYVEVDTCVQNGTAPCVFRFIKKNGDHLEIDTIGDQLPQITGLQLTCSSRALEKAK